MFGFTIHPNPEGHTTPISEAKDREAFFRNLEKRFNRFHLSEWSTDGDSRESLTTFEPQNSQRYIFYIAKLKFKIRTDLNTSPRWKQSEADLTTTVDQVLQRLHINADGCTIIINGHEASRTDLISQYCSLGRPISIDILPQRELLQKLPRDPAFDFMSDITVDFVAFRFRTTVARDTCVRIVDLRREVPLPPSLSTDHRNGLDFSSAGQTLPDNALISSFLFPNRPLECSLAPGAVLTLTAGALETKGFFRRMPRAERLPVSFRVSSSFPVGLLPPKSPMVRCFPRANRGQ
jgi:hypothetical protein